MKLPSPVLRAMEKLEREIGCTDDHEMADAARDLLAELRRLQKQDPVDPQTTHALRRVSS